jgi:hypothetical protein
MFARTNIDDARGLSIPFRSRPCAASPAHMDRGWSVPGPGFRASSLREPGLFIRVRTPETKRPMHGVGAPARA